MKRATSIGPEIISSGFIEKGGKFLLIMCPKFKVWRVPGGRVEWGEKIEDALIREMEEETGVVFENPLYVGRGQDTQFHIRGKMECSRVLMFFHVQTDQELTLDPAEVEDHQRVDFEEIKTIQNKEGALDDLFQRNPDLSL